MKKIIVSIITILAISFIFIQVWSRLSESNREYQYYKSLSRYEKIVYACSKDITYFSGEYNLWTDSQRKDCEEWTFNNLNK